MNIIFDLHGVIFSYDPILLNDLIYTLKPGLEILQACANQTDENGQRLHKLYILSNWGKPGFTKMKAQHSDILALFDGYVISGECAYSKPQKEIFELLIAKYNLTGKECVFIDDNELNIVAAHQFGWTNIFYNNPESVKQRLIDLKILK